MKQEPSRVRVLGVVDTSYTFSRSIGAWLWWIIVWLQYLCVGSRDRFQLIQKSWCLSLGTWAT